MDYGELSIRPTEATDAIGQLAELAERVKRVMETEAINLSVELSARDEVSQRVATTLNQVHESFGKTSDLGQQRLRELSTALRTHTGNLIASDEAL